MLGENKLKTLELINTKENLRTLSFPYLIILLNLYSLPFHSSPVHLPPPFKCQNISFVLLSFAHSFAC